MVNKEVIDLIEWARDEYTKTPFMYPGDEYVVSYVKNHVSAGFSIEESINMTREKIAIEVHAKTIDYALGGSGIVAVDFIAKLNTEALNAARAADELSRQMGMAVGKYETLPRKTKPKHKGWQRPYKYHR